MNMNNVKAKKVNRGLQFFIFDIFSYIINQILAKKSKNSCIRLLNNVL